MTAVVTIIQTPVYSQEVGRVLATYAFDDLAAAQEVARKFEYVYVNDGQEVITAHVQATRDGSNVNALHLAYTVQFKDGEYEQTHWLVTDAEIDAADDLKQELGHYNSGAGKNLESVKHRIANGPYYTFNPHLVYELNKTL